MTKISGKVHSGLDNISQFSNQKEKNLLSPNFYENFEAINYSTQTFFPFDLAHRNFIRGKFPTDYFSIFSGDKIARGEVYGSCHLEPN